MKEIVDAQILKTLCVHYPLAFDGIQFERDSGCLAYRVSAAGVPYFLRVTKPLFADTTLTSLAIHLYLQEQGFSVPRVFPTKDGQPYVQARDGEDVRYYILYEYIKGEEVDPEVDAEQIGTFVGHLHRIMANYPGELPVRDREYFINRYLRIMRQKAYPHVDEFAALGDALWARVEALPRGCCHGDLYRGNILKTMDGKLVLLDFDTFCMGFSQYDAALICNMTDFFALEPDGYYKTKAVYERYLPAYQRVMPLSPEEQAAVYDLIALYHFALQATIIELFGLDCVDHAFLDRQLIWLRNWQTQREAEGGN